MFGKRKYSYAQIALSLIQCMNIVDICVHLMEDVGKIGVLVGWREVRQDSISESILDATKWLIFLLVLS